jgi:hypothetical protein
VNARHKLVEDYEHFPFIFFFPTNLCIAYTVVCSQRCSKLPYVSFLCVNELPIDRKLKCK